MLPYLTESFGNPSSAHAFGRRRGRRSTTPTSGSPRRIGAEAARDRVHVAAARRPTTSRSRARAWAGKARGHRIVTTADRAPRGRAHPALPREVRLRDRRAAGRPLRPGRSDQLDAALTDRTILVSILLANNEVGTLQPIAGHRRARPGPKGVLLHVDAVQAAPYVDLDVETLGADLVSLGAHKFEGPKGIGALYVRHGTHILAQQHGGTQERYRRAGTENVAGAVGMATAFELTCAERPATVEPPAPAGRDRLRDGAAGRGRRRADRPPDGAPAGPRSRSSRRGTDGVVGRAVARPRGHRRVGRLGLHDRLDRGQPRADRDGLPGGRGARRAAAVARPDDDRRRDRDRGRGRAAGRRLDAHRRRRRRRRPARPGRSPGWR